MRDTDGECVECGRFCDSSDDLCNACFDRLTEANKLCYLHGSSGGVAFDCETGRVIYADEEYKDIVRIDVNELTETYGTSFGCHDILDVGYWTSSGFYEPPCIDFRRDRDAQLHENGLCNTLGCEHCKRIESEQPA